MSPADALRPARYAESLRERPRWVASFVVVCVLYIVLGLASAGSRASLTAGHLPPAATPAARDATKEMLDGAIVVRSLFLPVRLFAGWSLFALALLYACRAWKSRSGLRFVQVFAAVVYSEIAPLLGAVAALLVAGSSGADAAQSPPWVPGGLDLLIATHDFTARYALNSVNVFSLAYIALLTVTLSGATGLSRAKSAVSALFAWAAALFVNAAIIHALRSEFQFLI
jgi:hypothetical protein